MAPIDRSLLRAVYSQLLEETNALCLLFGLILELLAVVEILEFLALQEGSE